MINFFTTFLTVFLVAAQVFATPIPMNKGDKAPSDGVFLPTATAADIMGRLESSQKTCDALSDAAVKKAVAPVDLKLKLCLDRNIFNNELSVSKLAAKDQYIQQLEKRVSDPGISRSWVLFGGLTLGVLLTIGAGIAMNNAAAN